MRSRSRILNSALISCIAAKCCILRISFQIIRREMTKMMRILTQMASLCNQRQKISTRMVVKAVVKPTSPT